MYGGNKNSVLSFKSPGTCEQDDENNSALMHLQKVSMNEEECDVAIDHIIPRKDNLYFMYDSPI